MDNDREVYGPFILPVGAAPPSMASDRQLIGYAVVWGAVSDVRSDGFRHQYMRGSIQWADVVNALLNHDLSRPLASTRNGTLRIIEDNYGARATIDLSDTANGRHIYHRVQGRMLRGMSFSGQRVAYERTADPKMVRVTRFIASEVSLAIHPGFVETIVTIAPNFRPAMAHRQRTRLDRIKLRSFGLGG